MSQNQPMTENALAPRRQISIRLDRIKRAPAVNIVGLPELIGLAGAALLAVLVVFAYFYFYVPANLRLNSIETEKTRLVALRQASGSALEEGLTTKESVERINQSLKNFESNSLPAEGTGRMSLYQTLNNLIKTNGLRNTAGPSYSPLEIAGTKNQAQPTVTAEKQSTAKWQSIYPGIAVSVTVEGPYQNVRHFIRDIETSRQFLIINAIELERITQSGADQDQLSGGMPPAGFGRPAAPTVPAARGAQVSLRIDLATYFQRPANGTTP